MNCRFTHLSITLCAALAWCAATQGIAATVFPLLKPGHNSWEDDDFESLVLDANNSGVIDVGDRFVGVFRVTTINSVGVAAAGKPTLTAVFGLELLSKTSSGNSMTLGFGPLQSSPYATGVNDAIAQWSSPAMAAVLTALQVGDLPTINSNDTMAIIYDHPNWGLTNAAAVGAIDTFDDDVGAVPIAEFGFTGTYSPSTLGTDLDEFWQTVGQYNFDPIGGPVEDLDVDEPADLIRLLQTGWGPTNLLSLNLTYMYPYPYVAFSPTNVVFPSLQGTDLQATGTFVQPTQQNPGRFAISTDTDLVVNLLMTPEPASWAIFAGVFGVACAWRGRRRSRPVGTGSCHKS